MRARAAAAGEPALASVVIPCFNQAQFLGDAIESALAQTWPAVEVVVVDDGSTDDTPAVAARFPAVRYVRQANAGLAAARNAGLAASRGTYVVFLDADDRLLPGAVEAGVRRLEAAPECAFVSGHFRYVEADGSLRVEHPQQAVPADPYLALLRGNHIGMHATVTYRRAALEAAGGFDPSLPACEDYDLYLRLARTLPALRHGEVVAEYRQHGANMSRDLPLMLRTVLRVHRAEWARARHDPVRRAGWRAGRRAWQLHYGELLVEDAARRWAAGDRAGAARAAATLVRWAPRYLARRARERLAELRRASTPRRVARRLLRAAGAGRP